MSGSPHPYRIPAWSGAALAPIALVAALANSSQDHFVHGLRYLLPALAVVLPMTLLRRAPLPALALMLVAGFALTTLLRSWEDGYPQDLRYLVFLTLDVAVGVIAARRPWRVSVTAALLVFAAEAGAVAVNPLRADGLGQSRLLLTMALLIALLVGNAQRQRRQRTEAQRAQVAAQAITAERTRIARDLHDMVAHTIGVIAIQAGAGSRVFHSQPATAHEALDAIEATSRETLAGLRRMLDDLRAATPEAASGEFAPAGVPAGALSSPGARAFSATGSDLGGAPGLANLDRLVERARRAGLRVEVRWPGKRRPLPADVDLTAYRVVQEAVTNVVRHAGTPECVVTIDQRDTELVVEIVDEGHGGSGDGHGYGLIGMRERIGLLNGDLAAGPRPACGFAVTARLPMPVRTR
ncbi:sensor histidine kinase [Actinoplanes sp. NPDC049265]|uniref:sensor histidine kinase n=1 Tax=Actinoplanes sp. NPDC049265 TaxID=3363902 RepID=UPI0037117E5E